MSDAIAKSNGALEDAYQRRLALLREARGLDPKVTHKRLAAVCGVTEIALLNQLKRADQAAPADVG